MHTTFPKATTQVLEGGFLRLSQILGDPRSNTPALLPISKSGWFAGIKSGRFPKGIKLGRATVWPVKEIRALIERINTGGAAL